MKNEKSERKFDFRPMGLAIKKAREKKGMTQEQLADIIGRDTRTVMYHENDGQHPSLLNWKPRWRRWTWGRFWGCGCSLRSLASR